MRRYSLNVLFIAVFILSCSPIPKDYNPPDYHKIAVIAIYPSQIEYDIDSKEDLVEAVAEGLMDDIIEALSGDYPEWTVTSELARISTNCGYNVYLVGPDDYFEERKERVDVAAQKRYEGFIPGDYRDYIYQMKSLIGRHMAPTAYLTGRQDDDDRKSFWLEMRRWDNDERIFSMSFSYFMRHYNEFYCGADVEESMEEEGKPDGTSEEVIDPETGKGVEVK